MSLNQLLLEMIGRPVLYHFTTYKNLQPIVEMDTLKKSNSYIEVGDAVYLTRNYRAEIFSKMYLSVRLTLDRDKLQSFFKIVPRMDSLPTYERKYYDKLNDEDKKRVRYSRQDYHEEDEEIIKKKDIENLHRFILQVDIMMKDEYMKGYDANELERQMNNEKEIKLNHVVDSEDTWQTLNLLKEYNKMMTSPNFKHYKGKIKVVDKWVPVKL